MLGDKDLAFEHLFVAANGGWSTAGDLVEVIPQFDVLADDPRLAEIQEIMLETVNRDRAVVGLPPFDADYQVMLQPLESGT
jgi:hypothetical protein